MVLFDMPSREVCTVRRGMSGSPMQALTLMNSVTYVEAAKKFAELMLARGGSLDEQIAWGFRRATLRQPDRAELELIVAGHNRRLARYRADPDKAVRLLKNGESQVADDIDKVELAAMTVVASILLNRDEVITK